MKIKFIISLFLLIVSAVSVQAVDYNVTPEEFNAALDDVNLQTENCTITLTGSGPFVIDHNNNNYPNEYSKIRRISTNLTIIGDGQTLAWNLISSGTYVFMPTFFWDRLFDTSANLTINNCKLDFSGIVFNGSINTAIVASGTGSVSLSNCNIGNRSHPLLSSESSTSSLTNCFFEGIDTPLSDMSNLITGNTNVSINPFYFSSVMDTAWHINAGKTDNVNKIDFGVPVEDNNIWFTDDYNLQADNYGVVKVTENCSVTGVFSTVTYSSPMVDELRVEDEVVLNLDGPIEVNGATVIGEKADVTVLGNLETVNLQLGKESKLTNKNTLKVTSLEFKDESKLTNESTLTVTSSVHVHDDVYVNSATSFGTVSTTVDLTFDNAGSDYRFFTPPFDIQLSSLADVVVETAYGDGLANSVWVLEYNEAKKATDSINSPWEFLGFNDILYAGQGYSIWTEKDVISFTKVASYPNVNDLINTKIELSDELLGKNGFNYLGNPYSLPLELPVNGDVIAYYYYDGEDYLTTAAGVPSPYWASKIVPSYGAFFVQVKYADISFDRPTSLVASPLERVKSATIASEPSYIRVALKNGQKYDDAVVRFNDGAEFGVDNYDASKIYPQGSNEKALISTSNASAGGNYTIQGLPSVSSLTRGEVITLPLTINTGVAGDYDMSLTFNNMDEDLEVSLYDDVDGSVHDLKDQTVTLSLAKETSKRYSLKIVKSGTVTGVDAYAKEAPCQVVVRADNFEVKLADDKIAEVKMYDINGRLVLQGNTQSTSVYSTGFYSAGVYIVSVSTEGAAPYMQKIVIR